MPTVKTWARRSIRAETAFPADELRGSAGAKDKKSGVAAGTGSFFRKRAAMALPNFLEEENISVR